MYPTELHTSITSPTNGQASPQFTFNERRWQFAHTHAMLLKPLCTQTHNSMCKLLLYNVRQLTSFKLHLSLCMCADVTMRKARGCLDLQVDFMQCLPFPFINIKLRNISYPIRFLFQIGQLTGLSESQLTKYTKVIQ